MTVLIVEDETAAFENLNDILIQIDPNIEIAGNTESIVQTVSWLQKNPMPDVIFMDIHLSDGSAFCIFDLFELETPIIFTTAYDEYAIDAFKVNSIDYLLKPIKVEDISNAVKKLNRRSPLELSQKMWDISQASSKLRYRDKLLLPYKDQLIPVGINEVGCFYTTEKKTLIIMNDESTYCYSKSLDQIMSTLNPFNFFRANKQFIISKNAINNITIWFDSRLLVSINVNTPEKIYISKNRAAEFKEWIVN